MPNSLAAEVFVRIDNSTFQVAGSIEEQFANWGWGLRVPDWTVNTAVTSGRKTLVPVELAEASKREVEEVTWVATIVGCRNQIELST